MPSQVVAQPHVRSQSKLFPRLTEFQGRPGTLQLIHCPHTWGWRIKGLTSRWFAAADMVSALRQATDACGLTIRAADWRLEVRS